MWSQEGGDNRLTSHPQKAISEHPSKSVRLKKKAEPRSSSGAHISAWGSQEFGGGSAMPQDGELYLVFKSKLQTLPSHWSLVRFPAGKGKTILSGWLKTQPQQGPGKRLGKQAPALQPAQWGSVRTGPQAEEGQPGWAGYWETSASSPGEGACIAIFHCLSLGGTCLSPPVLGSSAKSSRIVC